MEYDPHGSREAESAKGEWLVRFVMFRCFGDPFSLWSQTLTAMAYKDALSVNHSLGATACCSVATSRRKMTHTIFHRCVSCTVGLSFSSDKWPSLRIHSQKKDRKEWGCREGVGGGGTKKSTHTITNAKFENGKYRANIRSVATSSISGKFLRYLPAKSRQRSQRMYTYRCF